MGWKTETDPAQHLMPLRAACDASLRARVQLLAGDRCDRTIYTRFLTMQPNSILMYWPASGALEFAQSGQSVECFFEHENTRFAFLSRTQGRIIHVLANDTRALALRLEMPEIVEKRQQRGAFRVATQDLAPIYVDLTEIRPDGQQGCVLSAQLSNLSATGIGTIAECSRAMIPQRRAVCRADFRLPNQFEVFRLPLELVHFREIPQSEQRWYLGWRFCPSEDVRTMREQQRRLEKFIADRQREMARRAAN